VTSVILLAAAAITAVAYPGVPVSRSSADGRALFVQRCGGCHLQGGFGTVTIARRSPGEPSLLVERHPPADLVRTVVRNGFRSMPPIRRAEVDDAQLAKISAYLGGAGK
jgi:mono/diheme cytochrome c family protein